MRDTKALHPDLQVKIVELEDLCRKNGITIGISECLRTTAEQDDLYAKGRTKPGPKVTNAPGYSYSSMHQWGVAFDFYLKMDIDGDGLISDDAYNNAKRTFNKVGELGKSIGLEWGGDWTSIKDLPHFQLPNWGSTATKLKAKYGTPEKFIATWKSAAGQSAASTVKKNEEIKDTTANRIESARSFDRKYAGTYKAKKNCNLLASAGSGVVVSVKKDTAVQCYGYYTAKNRKVYLYVQYGKKTGFILQSNFART